MGAKKKKQILKRHKAQKKILLPKNSVHLGKLYPFHFIKKDNTGFTENTINMSFQIR